jgi:AbrB family looped-hinge helix DNA binding protein
LRITSKGQVTIPVAIREQAGLLPHTEVDFEIDGDAVRIVRAKSPKSETRGQRAVRLLRGSGTVRMSTDEIMSLMRGKPADDGGDEDAR